MAHMRLRLQDSLDGSGGTQQRSGAALDDKSRDGKEPATRNPLGHPARTPSGSHSFLLKKAARASPAGLHAMGDAPRSGYVTKELCAVTDTGAVALFSAHT
nr:hypothetical protein [Streptomyces spiroverticillatus]